MTDEGIIADDSTKLFSKEILSNQKERLHQDKIIERVRKSNDRKVNYQIRGDPPIFPAHGPPLPKKPRKVQTDHKSKEETRDEPCKTAAQSNRGLTLQKRVSTLGKSALSTSTPVEHNFVPTQQKSCSTPESWQKPPLYSDPQFEVMEQKSSNTYQDWNTSSNRPATMTSASNFSSEDNSNYFVHGRNQGFDQTAPYAQQLAQKQTQSQSNHNGNMNTSHRPEHSWYDNPQRQGNPHLHEHLTPQRPARPLYHSAQSYDSAMASSQFYPSSQYPSTPVNYPFQSTGPYSGQYQPMQLTGPFGLHQWNNQGHPPGSYPMSEFDGHARSRSADNPSNRSEGIMSGGFIGSTDEGSQNSTVLTDLDGGLNLTRSSDQNLHPRVLNSTSSGETPVTSVTHTSDMPPVHQSRSPLNCKEQSPINEQHVVDNHVNDDQDRNTANDQRQLLHPSVSSSSALVDPEDMNGEDEVMKADDRSGHLNGLDDDYNDDWRNASDEEAIENEEPIATCNKQQIDRAARALAQCLPQHGQYSYEFFRFTEKFIVELLLMFNKLTRTSTCNSVKYYFQF